MITWEREHGEIVACIENGIRYTILAVMERPRLHALYHIEIHKEEADGKDISETDER